MKAVLLDEARFLEGLELPKPAKVSEYVTFDKTPQDNKVIIERCQDADIMICGTLRIEREVIEALPNLKLIQLSSSGMNTIDQEACKENKVALYNASAFAAKSVPEHTFMLMLNALRAGIHYHQEVADGSWRKDRSSQINQAPMIDVEGQTLGIIGVGTIGKRVSELAQAFGMTVLWAEHQGVEPRSDDYTDFETVLAAADVISLHCPLTPETKHLINKDTLAKMSKQPLIVNVARGAVVDSKAMAQAIENQQVLGYATDVFEKEPIATDDPLLKLAEQQHPRVIFSPHVASGSKNAHHKLWQIVQEQINTFIDNTDINNTDEKSNDSSSNHKKNK